ncbi:MAG: serine hydrolase domain-containing protein [Pseudomonadota bacterium]
MFAAMPTYKRNSNGISNVYCLLNMTWSAALMVLGLFACNKSYEPLNEDAFAKIADTVLADLEDRDLFSGVVAVSLRGNIVYMGAAGYADRRSNALNAVETVYPLLSITKSFTASAILLLAEDGLVSLSDPVSTFYPGAPASWSDITIGHLLSHRAGIQDCDCTGSEYALKAQKFDTYMDYVDLAAKEPLAFLPGEGFRYSNAGYGLLTLVVEQASEMSYCSFIRQNIASVLTMNGLGCGLITDNEIQGYVNDPTVDAPARRWTEGKNTPLEVLGGFGRLQSTAYELALWPHFLATGNLLTTPSIKDMFTDHGGAYGFGWRFAEKDDRGLIWHSGNDPSAGFASIVEYYPEYDLAIAVLSNDTRTIGETATLRIGDSDRTFPANGARKVINEISRAFFLNHNGSIR